MARFVRLTAALGFLLEISSSAAACPFCDSSIAEQVRAGIFNSDFGYHLGVALAPFPILIVAARPANCTSASGKCTGP